MEGGSGRTLGHNLNGEAPLGIVPPFNRLAKIPLEPVWVFTREEFGLRVSQAASLVVGEEVKLAPGIR